MINDKILDFIKTKPEVIDVIGYGSGVKKQDGYTNDIKKQIDLIVTVEDTKKWHKENYKNNKEEYSNLGFLISNPLYNIGTDINYITDIKYKDDTFKLGIIDKKDMLFDLYSWSNFYMAGRCQKPIEKVICDEKLNNAIYYNRLNALKCALILNYGNIITEEDLYKTICSLSYIGDIRMTFHCENPNKINNIVSASMEEFRKMYNEVNEDLFINKDGYIYNNNSALIKDFFDFPSCMLGYLKNNIEELTCEQLKQCILEYLKMTNLKSSIAQPIKSMTLNGTSKSLGYLKEKVKKGKM